MRILQRATFYLVLADKIDSIIDLLLLKFYSAIKRYLCCIKIKLAWESFSAVIFVIVHLNIVIFKQKLYCSQSSLGLSCRLYGSLTLLVLLKETNDRFGNVCTQTSL